MNPRTFETVIDVLSEKILDQQNLLLKQEQFIDGQRDENKKLTEKIQQMWPNPEYGFFQTGHPNCKCAPIKIRKNKK